MTMLARPLDNAVKPRFKDAKQHTTQRHVCVSKGSKINWRGQCRAMLSHELGADCQVIGGVIGHYGHYSVTCSSLVLFFAINIKST